MKKYLLLAALFLIASPAFAYTSPAVNFVKTNNDPPRILCDDYPSSPPTDCNAVLNNFTTPGTTIYIWGDNSFNGTYTVLSSGTAGDNTSLLVDPAPPATSAGSYTSAYFSDSPEPPPPPTTTPFEDMLASSSAGIASTTGFNIGSVVTWAGDNLIKLFIGSGLAVLFALRYWIAALAVIGAIIYFAYRAFRFFKH